MATTAMIAIAANMMPRILDKAACRSGSTTRKDSGNEQRQRQATGKDATAVSTSRGNRDTDRMGLRKAAP